MDSNAWLLSTGPIVYVDVYFCGRYIIDIKVIFWPNNKGSFGVDLL